jgi:hypothetical protein
MSTTVPSNSACSIITEEPLKDHSGDDDEKQNQNQTTMTMTMTMTIPPPPSPGAVRGYNRPEGILDTSGHSLMSTSSSHHNSFESPSSSTRPRLPRKAVVVSPHAVRGYGRPDDFLDSSSHHSSSRKNCYCSWSPKKLPAGPVPGGLNKSSHSHHNSATRNRRTSSNTFLSIPVPSVFDPQEGIRSTVSTVGTRQPSPGKGPSHHRRGKSAGIPTDVRSPVRDIIRTPACDWLIKHLTSTIIKEPNNSF